MRYVTKATLDKSAALQGRDDETRAQILADAEFIESHVAAHEWIDDGDLRPHLEKLGIDPDRTNAALAFLDETGRVVAVETTNPTDETVAIRTSA